MMTPEIAAAVLAEREAVAKLIEKASVTFHREKDSGPVFDAIATLKALAAKVRARPNPEAQS